MILVLSVSTGLMAGIYFIFSIVVVKALSLLPGSDGARAMNSINDVILKTIFMPLFFISSLWYLGLFVWCIFVSSASLPHLIWACLFYLIGMFGVTAFGNVPLNNQLKLATDDPHKLLDTWQDYSRRWVNLNHVRTVSCIVALVLLNYRA